ncbi:MAG: hypothetical protein K6F73_04010 [Lachnospiraceae bacterium]|nr:hypothetical protein [Lachnospiraceae bacterium]
MKKSLILIVFTMVLAIGSTCIAYADVAVPTPAPTIVPEPTVAPTPVPTEAPTPTPVVAPSTVPVEAADPTPEPTPEAAPAVQPLKTVDLVIFAGQSNMSGRGGNAAAAPAVAVDTGYEFRYGTCPTGMYPMTEPFGIYSNGYLCDLPALRGGSLASAFMNTYYNSTGVPVLAFSAARGGSSIGYWQGAEVQGELSQKYDMIKAWCNSNHVAIRRSYVVWLQGETDGVANIAMNDYKVGLSNVFANLFAKGLDQVFVITIGRYAGLPGTYDNVIAAQIELCAQDPRFSLGSDALRNLPETYLTDGCHYNQAALNIAGSQCANAAAARSKMMGN